MIFNWLFQIQYFVEFK